MDNFDIVRSGIDYKKAGEMLYINGAKVSDILGSKETIRLGYFLVKNKFLLSDNYYVRKEFLDLYLQLRELGFSHQDSMCQFYILLGKRSFLDDIKMVEYICLGQVYHAISEYSKQWRKQKSTP